MLIYKTRAQCKSSRTLKRLDIPSDNPDKQTEKQKGNKERAIKIQRTPMVQVIDIHGVTKKTGPNVPNQEPTPGSSKASQIYWKAASNCKKKRKKTKETATNEEQGMKLMKQAQPSDRKLKKIRDETVLIVSKDGKTLSDTIRTLRLVEDPDKLQVRGLIKTKNANVLIRRKGDR